MPALNAESQVGKAIESIMGQDYPHILEVIVAAGDDATKRAAADKGAITVDNPSGKTPAGLNLAIALATGDVIVRCDAQSILPTQYVSKAVETMRRTGAANVGGMQVPAGDTFWERAIAAAMSSPLGAGDARYRTGGEEGPVETVYLGVFDRAVLEQVGGYDEDFVRTQDYELNHRIIEAGGVVWFDPRLEVQYKPRGSLKELWSQYFQYGQAKKKFMRRHPGSLRWRQLAPPFLVMVLVLSALAAIVWPWALTLWALYPIALLVGVLVMPRRLRPNLGTIPALATMHLAWGLGFLNGAEDE